MTKIYIGIDNGVSGTIAIIKDDEIIFLKTPVKKQQSYTKTKQNISRLDIMKFSMILSKHIKGQRCIAVIERPMVNPHKFKASLSAVRCLEATILGLEMYEIPYQYCDSKQWQKELLPSGIKGSPELKKASADIGCRLFPEHEEFIQKHGDADGLLIAEWARRLNL